MIIDEEKFIDYIIEIRKMSDLKISPYSGEYNHDILNYLVSRKKIIIPGSKRDEIIKIFTVYAKHICDETTIQVNDIYDNCYDNAEYYGTFGFSRFSERALSYMKHHSTDDIPINVYAFERMSIVPEFLHEVSIDTSKLSSIQLPEIKLPKNKVYSSFIEAEYQYIDKSLSILSTNLPFEYYSTIPFSDVFFYIDLDTNELFCSNTEFSKSLDMIYDIAQNGIRDPIVMKERGGTIVSTKDGYGRLFAALFLKLPLIPVTLYMCDFTVDDAEGFISQHMDINLANRICSPYFVFGT